MIVQPANKSICWAISKGSWQLVHSFMQAVYYAEQSSRPRQIWIARRQRARWLASTFRTLHTTYIPWNRNRLQIWFHCCQHAHVNMHIISGWVPPASISCKRCATTFALVWCYRPLSYAGAGLKLWFGCTHEGRIYMVFIGSMTRL